MNDRLDEDESLDDGTGRVIMKDGLKAQGKDEIRVE